MVYPATEVGTCIIYYDSDAIQGSNTMKKRKSPCVDICQFTGPSGWCTGCGRTRAESARWKKMKPYEANKIEKELKLRMAEMSESPPSLI